MIKQTAPGRWRGIFLSSLSCSHNFFRPVFGLFGHITRARIACKICGRLDKFMNGSDDRTGTRQDECQDDDEGGTGENT